MKSVSSMFFFALCFFPASGALVTDPKCADAEDFFLTIAGGYAPSSNQVSLEKNVLYFQRFLRDQKLAHRPLDIYFADGSSDRASLQVSDPEGLPPANRLMAEFFGSQRNLGLKYRAHRIPEIRGKTSPENIHRWFSQTGKKMKAGDRLLMYVATHGGSSRDEANPYDTTIYLWNNKRIKVSELDGHLNSLPEGVEVVAIMVQCHAGGFARLIFNGAAPDNGVSRQNRCGFFATVHSRQAAGCTPDINEADYEEYSTYFWAALGGETRNGETIDSPDYNENGIVSFDEAHAYAVLESDTIDLPIKTSGEFLRSASEFGDSDDSELLGKDVAYSTVLELASPIDREILEGLSRTLKLSGENRIESARREGRRRGSRSRRSRTRTGSRPTTKLAQLKRKISNDIRARWHDVANVMNPGAVELVTSRADEFVKAIERHPDYDEYRKLADDAKRSLSSTEKRVKFERFVRTAENVILENNLIKIGDDADIANYRRILAAEAGTLKPK